MVGRLFIPALRRCCAGGVIHDVADTSIGECEISASIRCLRPSRFARGYQREGCSGWGTLKANGVALGGVPSPCES